MCPEKTELEGNPYPAVEIETLNKLQIVEIQVPAFQKRSIRHTQIPQAKMPDPRSAEGWCQRLICARSVLSDVHICSFGPFRPRTCCELLDSGFSDCLNSDPLCVRDVLLLRCRRT